MLARWNQTALGEVAADLTVGHVGTMASEYVDHGVPFLRSQNVEPFRLNFDDVKYITPEFHTRIRKSALEAGDVVIVRTGKPGTAAVVPEGLGQLNCSDLVIVRPGPALDSRFLCYYVNGVAQGHVNANLVGAVQQHFNVGAARAMPIRVPPFAEQRAIASILGALDDKIDLNRRMNETLEELARTIFKSWFVDFDPVRVKAEGRQPVGMDAETAELFPSRFVESELGNIPQGWAVESLDGIADYRNGLALQNYRPDDGEPRLPVIKIAQLRSGAPDSGEWARRDIDPECVIDDGDIIFSWSGSLMVVIWCGGKGALNQHLFKVSSRTTPKWFFYRCTLRHLPEFQATAADKATTMGHIKRHHLHDAKCSLPPDRLLEAATRVFQPLLDRQVSCHLESRTLTGMRDLLLPKLISGELRIKDAEKLAEAVL